MNEQSLAVADDLVVTIAYTVRLADGELIDDSEDSGLLDYLHGHGQIVPGLERVLSGMRVGEETKVIVEPALGYGEWREDAFEEVPRDMFDEDVALSEGMDLLLEDEEGEVYEVWVDEVGEDTVILDFNHPLAGETLHFEVKIVDIRPATAEELAHGHAHGDTAHLN